MASLRLRDRDAIVTEEGLIFRVFGYSHPPNAYICDVEYASSDIFGSKNPKSFRTDGKNVFYKFYEDEGWRFVKHNFPQHMIWQATLSSRVVGVEQNNIFEVRKPNEMLRKLVEKGLRDELVDAMQNVLAIATKRSGLSIENFGVFGSLLHGFYHPKFSDIDLIIYGKKNLAKIRGTLQELYQKSGSQFSNEFASDESLRGKNWRFKNISLREFVWHQQRKAIYSLFNDEKSGRIIKTEFEPVRDWKEIEKESLEASIVRKGWVRILARVTEDADTPFIPSLYEVEPLEVLAGTKDACDIKRVVSYVEEFRMQACRDEKVCVEGNLEEVTTPKESFQQITLTYCPRYYEQVLKVVP